jgi:hypothetical protein
VETFSKIGSFLALALVGLVAAAPALRAQSTQLVLEPPLSQAFPLDVRPDGVRVPYPVLLNDHTVLRPADLLRFVYIDNNPVRVHVDGEAPVHKYMEGPHGTLTRDEDTGATTHGESQGSAWGPNNTDDTSGLFDGKKEDGKTNKKELQSEVWTQKDLFFEAFDHATDAGTTLVYTLPSQAKPLTTAIDLPEGMLLAEVGGHIRVLGLSPQSRVYAAGIRAGDELRSFGDGAPLATLDDFIRAYAATRHQAKISGDSSYVLNVWRSGEDGIVPVHIAAPPSIPSFL